MNSVSCPVPEEQRPINEYQDLKESWFFRWATLDRIGYLKPIAVLWAITWLISAPVAAVSFPPAKHLPQFLLFASAGALVIPGLALLRLYLGWAYVQRRLLNPAVFYEESGWYDGQMWEKPPEVLAQDRLVVSYQVQPILERLKKTFGAIAVGITIGVAVWFFL
ncbi:CGLD27 family protein [Leptolyngbya sp. FACHB-17]|uniref:CGLD27 family protein n=1 Tax=unclassified Leptolyngbya TaxID=2650499 RepID=UPI001680F399|nr:CGLD27 family protein [Leptolyngbya sp. FACHB-17]MBD2080318.1 CGLD27 family protein [Leptolyngbya sp. FACHB-17]